MVSFKTYRGHKVGFFVRGNLNSKVVTTTLARGVWSTKNMPPFALKIIMFALGIILFLSIVRELPSACRLSLDLQPGDVRVNKREMLRVAQARRQN